MMRLAEKVENSFPLLSTLEGFEAARIGRDPRCGVGVVEEGYIQLVQYLNS